MYACVVCCVLCFLDPVSVVYVHSVLPGKMLRRGGVCVCNCGPGVMWDSFKISCSLAIIPRVILGRAYTGSFGGVWDGGFALADLFRASSASATTSFSATHVRLCSAVNTPCRCRMGRGAIGSRRQNFAGTTLLSYSVAPVCKFAVFLPPHTGKSPCTNSQKKETIAGTKVKVKKINMTLSYKF